MIRTVFAFLLFLVPALPSFAENSPKIRIAVLKFGTVNWEMDTIRAKGLDQKNGFALEPIGLASGSASKIAFQGGAADAMVSDWIWVARQRAAGKDYVFIPYSKSVGGIAVPKDGNINSIEDLKGKTIGIAGGPLDKSWLILRAYAQKEHDFDLAAETEQVFGAPPLITQKTQDGEIDAAINYWHFLARMLARGFKIVAPVSEASDALGLDPETPLLGYVFKGSFVTANAEAIDGFIAASRSAKEILADDEEIWEILRPKMRAKTDAEFEQLKAGFRAGIPSPGPIDERSANVMLRLMSDLGGEALVGQATELPDGVFYQYGE